MFSFEKGITILALTLLKGTGTSAYTEAFYEFKIANICPVATPTHNVVVASQIMCGALCYSQGGICRGTCYNPLTKECRTYKGMTMMLTAAAPGFKIYWHVGDEVIKKDCAMGETGHNWYQARDFCESKGTTLATPMNQEENEMIRAMADSLEPGGLFWIGLNDDVQEDNYVVVHSGEPAPFIFWRSDQPNGGVDQNCMALEANSPGYFQDKDCTKTYSYICESLPVPL